jgi:DNA-binding MarR family transcriptional regulator
MLRPFDQCHKSTVAAGAFNDASDVLHLRHLRNILNLVNDQMRQIKSAHATNVTRICEGEFGVTRREWRFIGLLAAVGATAPSDLALHAGLDRSRTSKALMPLLANGLIERHSQPGDRRRAQLQLSPAGRQQHERLFPRIKRVNTALLSVLGDAQVQTLAEPLATLKRRAVEIVNSDLVDAQADRRRGGSRRAWGRAPRD